MLSKREGATYKLVYPWRGKVYWISFNYDNIASKGLSCDDIAL